LLLDALMLTLPQKALPAVRRPKPGWRHGVVLCGYFLLTLLMTWPLALQFTTVIPGDSFDGWQNYWNFWWLKVALVERVQNPYFTDLLYAPTGVSLYFHTLNPFNGLVTLPVQLAFGLIPAYNAVVLVSWVLGGYGVYLLARWVLGRSLPSASGPITDVAAFVAGAIFTFAPVHMAHLLGHTQVMALEWLPFYVLALLRGMARVHSGKSWLRDGLLCGLFLTFAGLCDWYFVLYLFLFTAIAIMGAWIALLTRRAWQWSLAIRFIGPAAVAGLLFAILLAPVLGPMVYEATHYDFMVRPSSDLYIFSATLMDFLLPNRMNTFFRDNGFSAWGNQIAPVSERTIALGYAALALAIVGLAATRKRVALWGVAAAIFLMLALGPRMHAWAITASDVPTNLANLHDLSPYTVVNTLVPFMRISRSVSRFAIMVELCVAVLAAVGLAWCLQRMGRRWAALLGGVVLVVVLAEFWEAPYPVSPPDTPAYYETLAQQPGSGAVLNLPMNYDRPGYLLYQTVHRRPITVAYISRDDPRTLTERVPLLQHWRHLGPDIIDVDPAKVGMTVLADLGVDQVILDRYKMPGGEERQYTEGLANALFAGVTPLYTDDRLTVYKTTPPSELVPYLELGPLNWGPLVVEESAHYRALGAGPADLFLLHTQDGSQVVIDYRSNAGATVSAGDSRWQMVAAPNSGSITVNVPPGTSRLTFSAPPNQVQIMRLALQTPAK
jgi:hypothetical protein